MLSWIVTDVKETFDLKVNNDTLDALKYLDRAFRLSDDQVSIFQATTLINDKKITSSEASYEHLPGVLTHKILEKIGEAVVEMIKMDRARIETGVMNECIATFTQLNIPKTGLSFLILSGFSSLLHERLSEGVLD